ncbi:Major Facilitator Superfamily protein [Quadrisphaera granulorum]|uniref:MFS transporter n=1 Tax=Quadrisphaera granulorum TaxID=317664 RepID=A0A316AAL5_9ACTN|nr:MFS transporter [Quadrisphaera granulorum]PWJ54238.1 MFS transporter [Quadrisphaera granulorum]SZE96377.1 Major Facilitator Superfamily protein [Quadrisphaera granulorum]
MDTTRPATPTPSLRTATLAIVGLSVVFLVEMLDGSLLTVALPTIARDLHASASDLQWVVSAYALTFGGLMLAFGAAADRFGRKRVMLVGLALFGVASAAVLAVRTPAGLVGVRAATGVAAAVTAPGTMALGFRLFDDDALRVRATAFISTVGLVGMAIGPTLGGLLLSVWPWQALIALNVPVAVLAAWCIGRGIPRDRPDELSRAPLDLLGATLGTAATAMALWAATLVVEAGPPTGPWLAAAGAVVCGVAFVVREQRTAHPALPLDLLRRPLVASGLAYQAALGLALVAISYTATLQFQLVWGWSPAQAALANLPQVLTMIAVGPLVERVVAKVGLLRAGPLGASAVVAGLLVYGLLGRHAYLWVALALMLTAAGMRLVMITAAINVMRGLPPERTSLGAALNDTSQEVASSIGLAVTGTVVTASLTGPLMSVGSSAASATAFEDAVTTATLALTGACVLLVAWAARQAAMSRRAST